MDTLHSGPREITDHLDDVETALVEGATRVRHLARASIVSTTPAGTGWYHDMAIEAARRDAIEARCNPYHR